MNISLLKPVVDCTMLTPEEHLTVGSPALVDPINHPNHLPGHNVSNTHPVFTSKVVAISLAEKMIETRNTVYRWK